MPDEPNTKQLSEPAGDDAGVEGVDRPTSSDPADPTRDASTGSAPRAQAEGTPAAVEDGAALARPEPGAVAESPDSQDRPSIFISYDHDDLDRVPAVRLLKEALDAQSAFSVFMDPDLKPGERWDERLEAQLKEAVAVVVLWTRESQDSEFVRDEATRANTMGKFFPVVLEPGATVPLGLGRVQWVDLTGYRGGTDHEQVRRLIAAIYARLDQPDREPDPVADQSRVAVANTLLPIGSVLLASLLLGGLFRQPWAVVVGAALLVLAGVFVTTGARFYGRLDARIGQALIARPVLRLNVALFVLLAAGYALAYWQVTSRLHLVVHPRLQQTEALGPGVQLQVLDTRERVLDSVPDFMGQTLVAGTRGGDVAIGRIHDQLIAAMGARDFAFYQDSLPDLPLENTETPLRTEASLNRKSTLELRLLRAGAPVAYDTVRLRDCDGYAYPALLQPSEMVCVAWRP